MSTSLGRQAEDAAASHLHRLGYNLLAQNWRTRWCEIDLIVQKNTTIHFVEAKYRSTTGFGTGLEYITPKKLQQMHFAAEFWLSRHGRHDHDYTLAAIELTGDPPTVTSWLEDIS